MIKIIMIICSILANLPFYAHADFLLGVTTHIAYKNQYSDFNIQAIKRIGLNSLRDEFKWGAVEKEKGIFSSPKTQFNYFSKAAELGILPLVILDYGNLLYEKGGKPVSSESIEAFANYAKYTAKLLSGKTNHFEIWNEWFPKPEPSSAESYFKLMQTVAPAIKEANKNAIVLTGGVTIFGGWVERIVGFGALKYVDGIGIHPYVQCEGDNRAEVLYNYVKDISSKLNKVNGGKPVPLYITEIGWPSHTGNCSNTPEVVAQYLARGLLLVRTIPEVKGFWWYDLKNDGTNTENSEHNFGLLNYDYTPKPALAALQDIAPFVIDAESVTRMPSPTGILAIEINNISGNKDYAFWTSDAKNINVRVNIIQKGSISPTLLRVGTHHSVTVAMPPNSSNFIIPLNGTPIILSGIKDMSILNTFDKN